MYHVLNRAAGRGTLFEKEADYDSFERILAQAWERLPTRIACYGLMPNHWHMVLWPREDGELSEFMRWLTVTHAQRCHAHRHTAGTGPVYQGRFKSFPVQEDRHFLTVCRYVERNALRANLVARAQDWRWGSLWRRRHTKAEERAFLLPLSAWPVLPPRNWAAVVNRSQTEEEVEGLRRSVARGSPFGNDNWRKRTAVKLGLDSTLRPRGRPKKRKRSEVGK